MYEDLVARAYGFDAGIALSVGPRGALGQIWRLDVGTRALALKEIWAEPPSDARLAAELAFARQASRAGVRVPASHPDREGRYLLTTPGGRWLRLYDWVDLRPVDLHAPATPELIGSLLARLHRCADAVTTEPDGGSPDPWYHRIPTDSAWADVLAADAPWVARLSDVVSAAAVLCAEVSAPDPACLILGHRDLHPENVLAGADGELVVVDWDNLGPVDPAREVAKALFDWYDSSPDAMRSLYETYLAEGGPARITGLADFSMLLATCLNFLLVQARVALDPRAEPANRGWAEREIAETLALLPTRAQLTAVLAAVDSPQGADGTFGLNAARPACHS